MRSRLIAAIGALAFGAACAQSGANTTLTASHQLAAGGKPTQAPLVPADQTRPLQPGESRDRAAEVRWRNVTSLSTGEQQTALSAAKADMVRPEQATTSPSTVASALFSSDVMGEIQPDRSVALSFVDRPVWLLEYDGFSVISRGPKSAPAAASDSTCPFFVFIDKQTQKVIIATSGCDVEHG